MRKQTIHYESAATGQAEILRKIEDRNDAAHALENLVYAQIERALPDLARREPSVDWQDVFSLLDESTDLIMRKGMTAFQTRLQDAAGNPDTKKIAAFCHLYNVMQTVRSYAPVLLERAHQTETDEAFLALKEAIHEMKDKGYSLDDAAKLLDEIRISKSFTSHPTESLSNEGVILCNKLVAAAEAQTPGERAKNIEQVIHEMVLCENFGASKKSGILEEIDASDRLAGIHNEGSNILERFVASALEEEYGAAPKEHVSLDIAPRSWDYDSDGKNNAEGWAMLAKMSGTTMHMLESARFCMGSALSLQPKLAKNIRFTDLTAALDGIIKKIEPIHARSREITEKLAVMKEPEVRAEVYKQLYEELQKVTADFGKIYNDVDAQNRGFHFYMDTLEDLDSIRSSLKATNLGAMLYIDEAYRNLRRNGFVLEKGQTRQNDIIHTQIIDNLFRHAPFRARKVLEAGEWADIDSKGGFSKMGIEHQHRLLEKVTQFCQQNGNRKDVLSDLFLANPLSFDKGGNGFPRQERTLLDRFRLRALYPLKFDQGIISDCSDLGPARQMFIADLFGMNEMKHMPLYEGRSTLSRQPQLLELFQRTGGSTGVNRRRELTMSDPLWNGFFRGRDVHEISTMFPCSDGERIAGSATRLETFGSIRTDIRESYDRRMPLEIMLGGGMSMGRFGGDPAIVRRVVEQELKAIAMERGIPFSRHDKSDRRTVRAALANSYTAQGRAPRYCTSTAGQVADLFASRVTEMIHGRLDLEGLVPDYHYIQKPGGMSPEMRAISTRLRDRAIDDFIKLRFATADASATNESPNIITNRLARMITTPHTIGFMNNGARPASKSGATEMTDVRAIENNERDYISRLHMGGYYGAGNLMLGLWKEVHKATPVIMPDDVRKFINDPEWEYNYFIKDVVDAGRADFTYALDKAGWKNPTFDSLVNVGKSVQLVKVAGQDHYQMVFDNDGGKITPEQAYLAKVYYDRLLFISMLEAAINTKPGKGATLKSSQADILKAFRPKDNSVHVDLGPLTKEKYKASVAIISEHERNMPGYAVQYMIEDHVTRQVAAGTAKEKVVAALGGEGFMRSAAAAYRAGTVPHWPLWSGAVNYGVHYDVKPQPAPRPRPLVKHDISL